MTTQTEALKLALEAYELEQSVENHGALMCAIKEALAQPEQEPVAWLCERKDGHFDVLTDKTCVKCFPVYTTPPQRTWVGLTDEQIESLFPEKQSDDGLAAYWLSFAQSIEAKLKEKNT